MRDLYQRLSLPPNANEQQIDTAVARCPNSALRQDATSVLTVTPHRETYDALHGTLSDIGRLRARLHALDAVKAETHDENGWQLTIDLAHALEMEVTAEGVETPAALALLTVMGCDMVQGFLISRPLALADAMLIVGLGGSAVLTDVVPSKTLIASADTMNRFTEAQDLGVHVAGATSDDDSLNGLEVDLEVVNTRLLRLAVTQSRDIRRGLERDGVHIVEGRGSMLDDRTVHVVAADGLGDGAPYDGGGEYRHLARVAALIIS